MEQNCYRLRPNVFSTCRLEFDFDLFGSSLSSLAPTYCSVLSYRHRMLKDCPPAPLLSVAVPPWNRALALLSEAGGAQENLKGRIFLVLPKWPTQPWWPLLLRLAQGKLVDLGTKPWISPAKFRPNYGAVGVWIG